MIEVFHSYGLKTVFTAPELAFDFRTFLLRFELDAACAAHDRRKNAIDNAAKAIFGGRDRTAAGSHPLRNLRLRD